MAKRKARKHLKIKLVPDKALIIFSAAFLAAGFFLLIYSFVVDARNRSCEDLNLGVPLNKYMKSEEGFEYCKGPSIYVLVTTECKHLFSCSASPAIQLQAQQMMQPEAEQ